MLSLYRKKQLTESFQDFKRIVMVDSNRVMKFSLEQKISAAPNVFAQDLAGESILLNLQTEQYFGLDDVGTQIWQTLLENNSIQNAINTLLAEYDVEPTKLHQDVENLVEELLANELVEVSNS